jgi:hypothetical protein
MHYQASTSKAALWSGRILTALVIAFLLFDCAIKILKLAPAVQATTQLGYSEALVPVIGVILLICLFFYAVPRLAVLGSILLTGYLGGAFASGLRAGKPLSNILFPFVFAIVMWLATYLREPRLRALVPLRRASPQGRTAAVGN